MDDPNPPRSARIPPQMQMDDQALADYIEATIQAEIEDQMRGGPATVPAQVQIDDLEGAFGAQTATTFANSEQTAPVKRLEDLAMKHEEITNLWQHGNGSLYRSHDHVMIPRFNARADDINLQLKLIRMGQTPIEEVLQRNEEGLVEDERLTRLASSSDLRAFNLAMDTKKSQIAVRNAEAIFKQAEAVFKQAERDSQRARASADEAVTQEDTQTVRTHTKSVMNANVAGTSYRETYAKLLGIRGLAVKAEKTETEYNARVLKDSKCVAYVKHMLQPDFPTEMLSSILRTATGSERLRWRLTGSVSLDAAVDEFFAWPSGLDEKTCKNIRPEAGTALMKETLIELPAEFTMSNDVAVLVIPPAISGEEQHIRRLVLDIKLEMRDGAIQTQLNRTRLGIGPLFSRFPSLRVLVVVLHIGIKRPWHEDKPFSAKTLALRSRLSYTKTEDLVTSLLRFIDMLYEERPTVRKFVRFVDRGVYTVRYNAPLLYAGPLVRVPKFVALQEQESSNEVDAPGQASGGPTVSIVAEQVLEQAYRYHYDTVLRP